MKAYGLKILCDDGYYWDSYASKSKELEDKVEKFFNEWKSKNSSITGYIIEEVERTELVEEYINCYNNPYS